MAVCNQKRSAIAVETMHFHMEGKKSQGKVQQQSEWLKRTYQ